MLSVAPSALFRPFRFAAPSGILFALFALGMLVGCSESVPKSGDDKAAANAEVPGESEVVPVPTVTDTAQNLLFSYVDVRGRIQAVATVASVPENVKSRVLVVDLKKTPEQRQAHRYAFFADLSTKAADGTYPVTVVSRYNAAKGEGAATLMPDIPEGTVIVYSAVWCGYCKKAKAWMKKNDVPFVERDVEKMPGAQAELTQKMKAAGVPGGGIPVIDWGGELIVGFNQARLEQKRKDQATAPGAGATP